MWVGGLCFVNCKKNHPNIVMSSSLMRKALEKRHNNSIPMHSASSCNHIVKWKLHFGQELGHLRLIFNAVCISVMSDRFCVMKVQLMQTFEDFLMVFWSVRSSMSSWWFLLTCARCWKMHVLCSVIYWSDKSCTFGAICMIPCYWQAG